MSATDVYGGSNDGLPSDLTIIVALGFAFAVLVGLLHVLAATLPKPRTWPVVIGAFAFWPLALQGRGWAAMGVLMLGMISFQVLRVLQERRQRISSKGRNNN